MSDQTKAGNDLLTPRTLTEEDLDRARKLRYADAIQASKESLGSFLANVVIDSRPDPQPWGRIIEPWQKRLVLPMIPAVEQMAGLRRDYKGPRSFYIVLPRGHDKTGLIARIANWSCGFARHNIRGSAYAKDEEQAGLLLKAAREELRLNPWMEGYVEARATGIVGARGQVNIQATDAGGSSGAKDDLIVCDELTWWKNKELFDVVFSGREKRPDSVFIVITNAGVRGTWQHDVLLRARRMKSSWYVFEAPEREFLAGWMSSEGVGEMREQLTRGIARRVVDNIWIDATETPLLDEEWILNCQDDSTLWTPEELAARKGDLYVGIDIGRSRDLTVIWTLELMKDGHAWTREVVTLEKMPFSRQKEEIRKRINRNVIAVRIDKGGIGMQLAEELEEEYGRYTVEGVQLTSGRQGQLALRVREYFQGARIHIPRSAVLRQDLQQVNEVSTSAGGVPMIETDRTGIGHADRFWACALALHGLPISLPKRNTRLPVGIRSKYAPR